MSIADQAKQKMAAALEHFKVEMKNIRTGRANPSMLDGVQVEVYGSMMRIKDIASVTVPEPRQLLVTPFDPQNLGAIRKGIEAANLGVNPLIDGKILRITIGQMDDATRKQMIKILHTKLEEAKVHIRGIRRDSNDLVRKSKDLPEDVQKKLEKDIQEQTDKACKEADDLCRKKEQEISTV